MEILARCPWCKDQFLQTRIYTPLSDKRLVPVQTTTEGLAHSETCPERPAKRFECLQCGKGYTQLKNLLQHEAHVHGIYPPDHFDAEGNLLKFECPKCERKIEGGYMKAKFERHKSRCKEGVESEPCPVCNNPIFPNAKHKCRLGKLSGVQHKRSYGQKIDMVDEFRAFEDLGPTERSLYLERVKKVGVTEKLRSEFGERIEQGFSSF